VALIPCGAAVPTRGASRPPRPGREQRPDHAVIHHPRPPRPIGHGRCHL